MESDDIGQQIRRSTPWLLPLAGALALVWFLVRVVPKPSRAAYPCQQAAQPLAGGFLVWLLTFVGAAAAFRHARRLYYRAHFTAAAGFVGVALVAGLLAVGQMPYTPTFAADPPAPNDPIGVARGIHPGRVVWVHNPQATDWDGTDNQGNNIGDGFWWESTNTDQDVVDQMLSRAVRGVAGVPEDGPAWDAIFRHFNRVHGNGDVGYQPGEKITIKINMVTVNRVHNNVDGNGNQIKWLGWVNTSPQVILALLRQLVYVVGVAPADITVGDTTAYFPNHYWDHCHPEFPDVHYLACSGEWGRLRADSSPGTPWETRAYWSTPDAQGKTPDYLPVAYAQAAYLINFACLKGHSSGITLCAKNHYGSFIRLPDEAGYYNLHLSLPNVGWSPGMGHYRAMVDILGHSELGGKTLLHFIDGLYAGYFWEGRPYKWASPPFGDGNAADWPSSLFASLDPVALDSVAHDFLLAEWPNVVTGGTGQPGSLQNGQQDYLHEAALADNPPSGTHYLPDGSGPGLASLGTHEHWNDAQHKQYSRNLGTGDGIELVHVSAHRIGDLNCDDEVDFGDINPFVQALADPAGYGAAFPTCNLLNADTNGDARVDFGDINPFVALLANPYRPGPRSAARTL